MQSAPAARSAAIAVSVLFNEPKLLKCHLSVIVAVCVCVSVLFNEPKLLKFFTVGVVVEVVQSFSALQRAEIAEMPIGYGALEITDEFQCSSTSRNC